MLIMCDLAYHQCNLFCCLYIAYYSFSEVHPLGWVVKDGTGMIGVILVSLWCTIQGRLQLSFFVHNLRHFRRCLGKTIGVDSGSGERPTGARGCHAGRVPEMTTKIRWNNWMHRRKGTWNGTDSSRLTNKRFHHTNIRVAPLKSYIMYRYDGSQPHV